MTDKSRADELNALAERVEAGSVEDQRLLLREAFEAIHGRSPTRVHGGSPEMAAWLSLFNPFYNMLVAKAYESAAMSLVPEGWHTKLAIEDRHSHSWGWTLRGGYGCDAHGRAAPPALALCAAAIRARADDERSREVGK